LLVDRRAIELSSPKEISGGYFGLSCGVVGIGPAIGVIDLDQFAVVVGIGILVVAHQERIIAIPAIEVLPLPIGRVFDNAIFTIA